MRNLILGAAITITLLSSYSSTHASETRWWDVCASAEGKFHGGNISDEVPDAEKQVIQTEHFAKWKTYEDEFVSFEYPDHELVKLTVNQANEPFNVVGGVCTSVDNSHTQSYVINVGQATFGVFLLNPSEWLDDGICFCGPMVHHAYKINDSTLTRFSMLPGGAVKKAQVLGGGLRFMAFEWTHLACSRTVYERMVASMTVKSKAPEGNEFLRNELIKHYGDDAKLGLIPRGGSVNLLINAFGEPEKKSSEGVWTWSWTGKEYPCTLTALIKDDKLVEYPENGISRDHSNPLRGSIPWGNKIIEQLKGINRSESELLFGGDSNETKIEPATKEDITQFRSLVTKNLTSGPNESKTQWNNAVRLAQDASEVGIKDEAWVKAVLTHGTGNAWEAYFLKETSPTQLPAWALGILKSHSNITHESSLDERDLDELTKALTEEQAEDWNNLASNFWQQEKSSLRYLALARSEIQDSAQVEDRIIIALKADPKLDQGLLSFHAMTAIRSTTIQNKEQLLPILEKLPEGREHSEWHDARKKAIDYLKPKEDQENEQK